ncbi:hypothetical protein AWQ21_12515 [Picosynechococcus sp. PCC 7003]|uniref:hypothetical protein n=1 Tax=Picosynechococcus sp. PCC 7003 TaxID=374981 RepID=UPI000810E625|nr:hypothetical protein [Picosynechococcus sp. PCC 7003]ANV85128.1 hypothetical protein AWQ21_12515 [Picosynechococcus sp. PCC 7003]
MAFDKRYMRQVHRRLVPIMIAPLLLTMLTGVLFQIADMTDNGANFAWLLDLHKGEFGPLNLEAIYPFLNGLGLLILIITGLIMWWSGRPRKRQES